MSLERTTDCQVSVFPRSEGPLALRVPLPAPGALCLGARLGDKVKEDEECGTQQHDVTSTTSVSRTRVSQENNIKSSNA